MPEGDTIFRTAANLGRALAGGRVVAFKSDFPQINRLHEDHPFLGRTIESVASVGKHLLIRLSGNVTLRTHLRMNGSWHLYRQGEPWHRSSRNARIVIETEQFVAVGFSIPVAEALPTDRESRDGNLRRLGHDLLSDQFNLNQTIERLRGMATSRLDDALLDQTIMAGIGNVYKSEILFLTGFSPARKVGSLDESDLERLVVCSRDLLRQNVAQDALHPGSRRTTRSMNPKERLWVYGRGTRPCRRCGVAIRRGLTGHNVRVTYWCPSCQPD